jgi:hypothetical protein
MELKDLLVHEFDAEECLICNEPCLFLAKCPNKQCTGKMHRHCVEKVRAA